MNAQNTTLSNLNKLGIFRSVNLGVTPLDSLDGKDTLNVYLSAGFDYPLEAELEMNVTSKSNSFLGPDWPSKSATTTCSGAARYSRCG